MFKVMKFKADGMPCVKSAVEAILEMRKAPGYDSLGRLVSRHVGDGDVTLYVRCGATSFWVSRKWEGSVVIISSISLPPALQGKGFVTELVSELSRHFDYVCFESLLRNPRFECWLENNQFTSITTAGTHYGAPRDYYRKSIVE